MSWPKTSVTYYHAQLGLLDKSHAINHRVVCRRFHHIVMHIYISKILYEKYTKKHGPQNHP